MTRPDAKRRTCGQATGEGRGANPIADAVWGQLDRAAIREGYGQDVVRAIEERYGRGVFAKTSGGKAKDRATLSNDGLASELSRLRAFARKAPAWTIW